MQKSQSAMLGNAQEIARAGQTSAVAPLEPLNNAQAALPPEAPVKPVGDDDIESALVNLKQQQNLFDASAKMVSVGNKTMGSLLDAIA